MAGGLTAKQVGWLRERSESFRELHDRTRAADAHAARVRARLEKKARLVLVANNDQADEISQ